MNETVLLVDDDPNLLRGIARLLRDQPYTLLTARSVDEAVLIVKSHPVSLIVTDEQMPGRSGSDLLEWLATHCPDVVRIILTGHASPETTMRAVNQGRVYRFFVKPCDPLLLAVAIRQGLEQRAPLACA